MYCIVKGVMIVMHAVKIIMEMLNVVMLFDHGGPGN